MAAELAHRDDIELHRVAVGILRLPVAGRQMKVAGFERGGDNLLGEIAEPAQRGLQRIGSHQVAVDDLDQFAMAVTPQVALEVGERGLRVARRWSGQFECARGEQCIDESGLELQVVQRIGAGDRQPLDFFTIVGAEAALAQVFREPLPGDPMVCQQRWIGVVRRHLEMKCK